jgi:hypothetical protein
MKEMGIKPEVQALALIAAAIILVVILASPIAKAATPEPQQFVHTYLNSPKGNWTSVDKPIFPVYLNDSQIP